MIFIKKGELELIKSVRFDKEPKSPYLRNFSPSHSANIAILGPGETVGEEFLSSKVHSYTCRVYSLTATIVCMTKNDFLEIIRSEDSQNMIINNNETREKDRKNRVNSLKLLQTSNHLVGEIENLNVSNKNNTESKKFFVFRGNVQSVTPTKKKSYKFLKESDFRHILSRSRLDIQTPLAKEMHKKNISIKYSALLNGLSEKFCENRYIHPIKIHKKKLSTRPGIGKSRLKSLEINKN